MTRAEKERIIVWLLARNPHWAMATLQKMSDMQLFAVYARVRREPVGGRK